MSEPRTKTGRWLTSGDGLDPDALSYHDVNGDPIDLRDMVHRIEDEAQSMRWPPRESPTVWVAERGQSENQVPTVWWTGSDWSTDANAALRFPDKAAAEAYIDARSRPTPSLVTGRTRWARAVEHGFTLPTESKP